MGPMRGPRTPQPSDPPTWDAGPPQRNNILRPFPAPHIAFVFLEESDEWDGAHLYICMYSMDVNSTFDRLCHFGFSNACENEGHYCVGVLECPLYNPISCKFSSLFENVVLGSLESFFQSDRQVNGSLYLMKAIALQPLQDISRFETIIPYFQSPLAFWLPGLQNRFHFIAAEGERGEEREFFTLDHKFWSRFSCDVIFKRMLYSYPFANFCLKGRLMF